MTIWSPIWSDKSLTRAQRTQAVQAAADPTRPAFVRPPVRSYQRPVQAVAPVFITTAEADINRATAQATARMETIKAKTAPVFHITTIGDKEHAAAQALTIAAIKAKVVAKPIKGTIKLSKYQQKKEAQRLVLKAAH